MIINFESMDNSLFEHNSDGVIIVYPYFDLTNIKKPVS